MRRWILLGVLAVALCGCSTFSWTSNKSVLGNRSGGIVPKAVTNAAEANQLAREHCAQYSLVPRVTAAQSETGGKLVFVCERPGQAPPPKEPIASYPGQPAEAYPGQDRKSVV